MKTRMIAVLILVALLLGACSQPDRAIQALERDGYQNILIEGYAWWGCGEGDTYRTKFKATKNGQPVEGAVCSGVMKGQTIRTF